MYVCMYVCMCVDYVLKLIFFCEKTKKLPFRQSCHVIHAAQSDRPAPITHSLTHSLTHLLTHSTSLHLTPLLSPAA